MLNYIWAGLIIFSLVFALTGDVSDLSRDSYRNGVPLVVTVAFPDGYDPDRRLQEVEVTVAPEALAEYPETTLETSATWTGALVIG